MDDLLLLREAIALIEDKKGEDVIVLDMRDVSIPVNYFLIASGDNPTHVKGIVNALLSALPLQVLHKEGIAERSWVLLDYGNVAIHIFQREMRQFYDLDSLWNDCMIDIKQFCCATHQESALL
ncbi:ribosome silencing factor [Candidatus Acetothermia bacterium]|nr:ribosome silencing factor [Candidatus Acetothermia bacterium]MCI2427031.1 ribosome silencing factor [Candidatus Acetothermia bacterium]MCI2428138.1 ribosome silencing factor [Candidatus Acetothermia bacterium]